MSAFAQPATGSNATQPPVRSPQGAKDGRSEEPFQSASPEQRSPPYILKVPRGSRTPVQTRTRDGDHNNRTAGAAAAGSGEIDSRLKSAGAKTGDVQISLSWNTIDDMDLHVSFTPGNGLVDNINWTNRLGRLSNGMLDIDMNANSGFLSAVPVENIFWPPQSSPSGVFTVYVHFFRSWSGANKVPVIVRIKNGAKTEVFQVVALLRSNPQQVKQFSRPAPRKREEAPSRQTVPTPMGLE